MRMLVFNALLLLCALASTSARPSMKKTAETVSNSYLVTLKKDEATRKDLDFDKLEQILKLRAEKAQMKRRFSFGRFNGFLLEEPDETELQKVLAMPEVEHVEPNYIFDMDTTEVTCSENMVGPENWGVARISQKEAVPDPSLWPSDGIPYRYEDGLDDVYIYVIDSGVNVDHTDFEGRASWGYTTPTVKEDDRKANFPDLDTDNRGHGTHVAAIAAGKNGVARNAKIVSVKTLNHKGKGYASDIIEAFEWAANDISAKKRKAVINASLGAPVVVKSVDDAVREVLNQNIPVVVSAGNDHNDACTYTPAGLGGSNSSIVTVGATTREEKMAGFSNWGKCVDVLAPGQSIESAAHYDTSDHILKSGTSMSAPAVSGIIARKLAKGEASTPSSVKALVELSATEVISDTADITDPDHFFYLNQAAFPTTPSLISYMAC